MNKPPKHLMIGDDGNLYDTRRIDWAYHAPLRPNYKQHHRAIDSIADLKATLRAGPYSWPGGYPLYFITADGGSLSFESVCKSLR